jgi:hypothetical protein
VTVGISQTNVVKNTISWNFGLQWSWAIVTLSWTSFSWTTNADWYFSIQADSWSISSDVIATKSWYMCNTMRNWPARLTSNVYDIRWKCLFPLTISDQLSHTTTSTWIIWNWKNDKWNVIKVSTWANSPFIELWNRTSYTQTWLTAWNSYTLRIKSCNDNYFVTDYWVPFEFCSPEVNLTASTLWVLPPSVTITANPMLVTNWSWTTLTWSSTNSDYCERSWVDISRWISSGPWIWTWWVVQTSPLITNPTKFDIRCHWTNGTFATWSVTVAINNSLQLCDKPDIVIWAWTESQQTWSACNVWTKKAWTWFLSYGAKYKSWNNTSIWSGWLNVSTWDYQDKWPCEEWYHVPSINEWEMAFFNILWEDNYNNWFNTIDIKNIRNTLLLPLSWKWYKNKIVSTWILWSYWTMDDSNESTKSKNFSTTTLSTNIQSTSYWLTVRCIKDAIN